MHFGLTTSSFANPRTLLNLSSTALSKTLLPLVALLVATFLAAPARADFVSVDITGPGGFGLTPTLGATLAEPYLIYSSVDYMDVAFTVSSAGTYYVSETAVFDVKNTTGVTWSGFTWELISNPSGSLVYDASSPTNSGLDFLGNLPSVSGSSTLATFSGGTVPDQQFLAPAFDIIVLSAGTYTIRETPIPVPEPAGLTLLAVGMVTAALYRRATRTR